MNFRKIFTAIALVLSFTIGVSAQKVGIKSNVLADATLSPNLGVEFRMAPKWTFDLSGQLNAWTIDSKKWKHWLVQPEARLWLCEAFQGSFFGLHALGGQFNIGHIKNNINIFGNDFSQLSDYRYQGWAVGAGIAYGYAWLLGKHWNLEAEIGIGWAHFEFDKYRACETCGTAVDSSKRHNYFGPTKLALNFEYLF